MGGGNPLEDAQIFSLDGLSPRGRGKLGGGDAVAGGDGSIPAWAGETVPSQAPLPPPREVYPRVGGGNTARIRNKGDSEGLSPRGRGKLYRTYFVTFQYGSIPAWAGETSPRHALRERPKVYPRVGGGNAPTADAPKPTNGLSPRGRGKRL